MQFCESENKKEEDGERGRDEEKEESHRESLFCFTCCISMNSVPLPIICQMNGHDTFCTTVPCAVVGSHHQNLHHLITSSSSSSSREEEEESDDDEDNMK